MVKIPEGVGIVRPRIKAGWEITTLTSEYPEPFEVYGEVFTKGFTEVTWSGGPIPSGYMDGFTLSVYYSYRPGESFRYEVEQWCTGKEKPGVFSLEVTLLDKRQAPPAPSTSPQSTPADFPKRLRELKAADVDVFAHLHARPERRRSLSLLPQETTL